MIEACPSCKKEIDLGSEFCSHCGHKLSIASSTLTSRQKTGIYLGSFFLSPLGILWFFKYFRSDNAETKKVGYASLIITIVPLVLTLVIVGRYLSSVSNIIDVYESNLKIYSELGF